MQSKARKRLLALIVFIILAGAFSSRLVFEELSLKPTPADSVLERVLPQAKIFRQRSSFVWEGFASEQQMQNAVGYIFLATNAQVTAETTGSGLLVGVDKSRIVRGALFLGGGGEPLYQGRDLLEEVLPGCSCYHLDEQVPLLISGYALGSDGQLLLHGYAFLSREAAPKVQGYAGPISLLIGMDLGGKVTGVSLLGHKETPGYADGINQPKFLKQFVSKSPSDSFSASSDFDAIARATISSQAVADSIRESIRVEAPKLLEGFEPVTQARVLLNLDWKTVLTIIWIFVSFVMLFFALQRGAPTWIRLAVQIGSLLLIGAVGVTYITSLHFGSFLLFQPPPILQALGLYFVLAFALITALFWGKVYCGYICPLGVLLDFAGYLVPKQFALNEKLDKILKWVKRIILVIALALSLGLGSVAVLKYEVFDTVFLLSGSVLAVLIAVGTLILAIPFGRFYCRYLCGVGVCLGVISNHAFAKLTLAKECDRCGNCRDICPVGAISLDDEKALVDPEECIRCGDCTRICPHLSKRKSSIWC